MKRFIYLVGVIMLILSFSACTESKITAGKEGVIDTVSGKADKGKTGKEIPKVDAEAYCKVKIMVKGENTVLMAGIEEEAISSDLYSVSPYGVSVIDEKGNEIGIDALKAGMTAEIAYNGMILETYPAMLSQIYQIRILEAENDIAGFYLQVLQDLYDTDAGLNSDISVLAFDLTQVNNLRSAEKSALVYMAGQHFGKETVTGTFEELCSEGYIDKDALFFPNGLFFQLKDSKIENDAFQFDAEKWRGGLGAYFFTDCKAEKINGVWEYTIGAEMIS